MPAIAQVPMNKIVNLPEKVRRSSAESSSSSIDDVPVGFTSRLCSSVGDLSVLSDRNLCIGGRRWRRSLKQTNFGGCAVDGSTKNSARKSHEPTMLSSRVITNNMTRGPDFHDLRLYFVGSQSRTDATACLDEMPMGTFLLRDGSIGLVLTAKIPVLRRIDGANGMGMNEHTYLTHLRVYGGKVTGEFWLTSGCRFESVEYLIQFYMDNPRLFFANLCTVDGNEIDFGKYNGMLIPLRVARLCRAINHPWTLHRPTGQFKATVLRRNARNFLLHIMLIAQRVHRLESSRSYRREVLALNAAASHATGPVDRDSACECDGESSAIYPSTHLESTVIESFQPSCEDTVDTTTSDLDSMALTEEFASKSRHRVGETKRRDSGHDSGGHVSTSDDGLMGRPPSSLPYLPVEMWLLLLKQFQLSDFLSTLRESSGVQSPAFFDSKTTPLWWYSMGWFLDDSIHD